MTARGRCCYYYLEHCIKTNHFAIKGVIKRAIYENLFGLSRLLKHVDSFLALRKMGRSPGGGGALPYMGYRGMCGPGYGFSAVLVINRVSN